MSALTLPASLILLLFLSLEVLGAPQPGQSILITANPPSPPLSNTTAWWGEWAKSRRDTVIAKYRQPNRKRGTGQNLIVNQGNDASFYGTLAVGTPPVSFDVLLDTGSSDFWVASSGCDLTCMGTANYVPAKSSTFKNLSADFAVSYGSGHATGTLVQDAVQMAGFAVPNQQFGSVISTSANFLQNPVTGLIGLAWQSLSSSGAMPFWQALASSGSWSSPVMAFHLTRYNNDTKAGSLEPGGSFTMGYLNQSLYTGKIDYQNIPTGQIGFWTQQITSITVQGNSISLPGGSASLAAIDTGTTLVAGPAAGIAALYAQIPGSSPATGLWEGFYTYPCTHEVTVEISFGGPSWAVSPADFQFQPTGPSSSYCYGAFYAIPASSGGPQWIIGDTFLKNVYSVFRYDPPSVGFAALSDAALRQNGIDAIIPSATLGASVPSVTNNAASMATRTPLAAALFISILLSFVMFF